jgi:cytochrome c biogenesis protein CcmG/thiol:disulfide interchange protein DsbE
MKTWHIILIAGLVGLLSLFYKGLWGDPRAIPTVLIGTPAPTFLAPDLHTGEAVQREQYQGKVVMLNFWASWCLECRDEHPALDAAWSRYRERGVVFVGVLFEDTIDDALAFAGEFATDWPLVDDPGSRTAIAYGVFGVPETFVIGPDGSVTAKRVGPVDYTWLTAEIDEALRAAEAA